MNIEIARAKVINHFGKTTSERREAMKDFLTKRFGADYDETPSDLGEALVMRALSENEWGTMLADEAEQLYQWLFDNYLQP